jgi:hypothetical protein
MDRIHNGGKKPGPGYRAAAPSGETVWRLVLSASAILLLLADFFVHRHAYFDWAGFPEVNAVFGLAGGVILVAAAWILRRMVRRGEDYYDR